MLAIVIGLVMASAFPAILVYAHELLPERVGLVSGMFFGFAFGLGGLGAAQCAPRFPAEHLKRRGSAGDGMLNCLSANTETEFE